MKELNDPDLLEHYLGAYEIESIFNEDLRPYLALYRYDHGELICSQGDPYDYLYVLVKGKLKIFTTSPEGKTLILSFKTPLDVVGDIEYVQNTEIINTVEAVSEVHMIAVHHRYLKKFASDHTPLLKFLLDVITQKFYVKSSSLSFNLLYPVEVRFASYLLSVCFDESDALYSGKLSTGALIDAANLIGTSYRHLNRVIQHLSQEGLVERHKGFIVVKDRNGLSKLANHKNIYE
ncbi:Crp/Fnr family transcriptional regulator [Fictibacillus barbaricus]|uniref:Cyclic nucleotide-binding domain-containing protein n=1 Tax=Fictibacillus barbaricus TaxID=182136 RepID=A0ABS2ZAL3_9BACL|nr:cyclic nucleotide-binding domain-containing protein [Fictibacillus barbaricus]MBN3544935.1 cyclic nucleotide-binding domain-containing protein [Fictibacillus barbaricus]GGB62972.1 catabolite gene activator protein [Fictibacillus barbaricus]